MPKGPTLGGPRGAQGAHEGAHGVPKGPTLGAHGVPKGPTRGAHGVPKGPTLGGPRGAQGAHEGANTFPGKEIYPVKINIFLESVFCPVTR